MKKGTLLALMALAGFALPAKADNINFTTFVPGSVIAAVEGQENTIAFNFAGNKFVGSVYFGANNAQLYSTNLSGGNVQLFSTPIPTAGGEVVVGASLGVGGFPTGDIYVGSEGGPNIYHITNAGGAPTLFATLPGAAGEVRQIFFDPGSSFGGNMLVTTTSGNIYEVDHLGNVSLLASVGEDTEGMDIAPSTWGSFAGDLLVGSEDSGTVRLVSPSGNVTVLGLLGEFPGAETISAIPLTLNASDPLQGFYVADYPLDIQFAAASNFTTQGLLGDVIVTDEFGGSTAWDVHYDSGTFDVSRFTFTGNQISQFEDGIFVTPERIQETGGTVPEPSSIVLFGSVMVVVGGLLRRKVRP
jgi:hypothetical protein